MGQGVTKPFIDAQKEAALRGRLADMRAQKAQRDVQLSMQIALARDRVMCAPSLFALSLKIVSVAMCFLCSESHGSLQSVRLQDVDD